MKLFCLCFGFIFFPWTTYAQFGPQRIIDDNIISITMVRAGDIDGDNDFDLVATLFDSVVWYENLDGNGNYNAPTLIGDGLIQTFSLRLGDLDGDTDLDIVATSFDNGEVFWYENTDGNGNFGPLQLISDAFLGPVDAIIADLNGDTNLDVVVADDVGDSISWFENLGGGTFGSKQFIPGSNSSGRNIEAADFDGDNDLDLITASTGSITLAWFENLDGDGNFGPPIEIQGNPTGVEEVYAADIDGDLDFDIVSATAFNDTVAWQENIDGLGSFGPIQIISTNADFVRSVFAVDLDNDNDIDVISASSIDEKIVWYENEDGLGTFGPEKIIETEAAGSRSVIAADLDDDGDEDILGTLRIDDKLTWYKNLTILSAEDFELANISLFPNPAKNSITIVAADRSISEITMYSAQGARVYHQEINGFSPTVDITSLSGGIYLVEVTSEEKSIALKFVKE